MRLTKFGHACVRIEHDGVAVVIDPGMWTEREAVEGADAILITHEHPDHYLPEHLRSTEAPIWTISAVMTQIAADAPDLAERVTVVAPGQHVDIGVPVEVVGELHAVIHPKMPRFDNSGYLLTLGETRVYHPGDALTVPESSVDLLCAPVSAPWLKASEAIDFARTVGAPRNLAIHDRIYSEAGHGILEGQMNRFLPEAGQEYLRLADGEELG